MSQNSEFFNTTDLCLAALLKSKNYELAAWEIVDTKFNTKRIIFFFERTEKVMSVVDDYLRGDFQQFKRFFNELKELKNLIYINTIRDLGGFDK
jgi:hypothetical protein